MNHPVAPLPLDAEDRSTLDMWARRATAPHRVVACRSMAKAASVSRSTVQRIRDAHGLQPHRVTTFKSSIGRQSGMTRSVGADWGPQILRKSLKS